MLELFNQHLIAFIATGCILLFLPIRLVLHKSTQEIVNDELFPAKHRTGVFYLFLSFSVSTTLLYFMIPERSKDGSHQTVQLLQYLDQVMAAPADQMPVNYLVIDGASFTHSAVDPDLLERSLLSKGFNVQVIQVALPGSNHFERHSILVKAERALQEKLAPGSNAVFLREVQLRYDMLPFAHIKSLNPRLLQYADLGTSIDIVKAQLDHFPRETLLSVAQKNADVLKLLAKASATNLLHLGWATRVLPQQNIPAYRGYSPNPEHSNMPLDAKRIQEVTQFIELLLSEEASFNIQIQNDQWLKDYVYWPIREADQGYWSKVMVFLPPNTRPAYYAYLDHFCGLYKAFACLFDESYLQAFKRMPTPDYWWDDQHIEAKGVPIFTEWLAQAIVDREVLK